MGIVGSLMSSNDGAKNSSSLYVNVPKLFNGCFFQLNTSGVGFSGGVLGPALGSHIEGLSGSYG